MWFVFFSVRTGIKHVSTVTSVRWCSLPITLWATKRGHTALCKYQAPVTPDNVSFYLSIIPKTDQKSTFRGHFECENRFPFFHCHSFLWTENCGLNWFLHILSLQTQSKEQHIHKCLRDPRQHQCKEAKQGEQWGKLEKKTIQAATRDKVFQPWSESRCIVDRLT